MRSNVRHLGFGGFLVKIARLIWWAGQVGLGCIVAVIWLRVTCAGVSQLYAFFLPLIFALCFRIVRYPTSSSVSVVGWERLSFLAGSSWS